MLMSILKHYKEFIAKNIASTRVWNLPACLSRMGVFQFDHMW